MNNNKLVSVIVPVYNVEKYLKQCVDSILGQKYQNIEIILVDDGSKDTSGKMCEELARIDNRIKVFHKENGGLVSAWQYGLKKSSEWSEFVVFIDSDDWVEEEHISAMVKEQERTGADIVVTGTKQAYEGYFNYINFVAEPKFYNTETLKTEMYPIMLNAGGFEKRGIPVSRWGKLIRKQIILDNLQYSDLQATFEEDLNIMFPVFMDMKSISLFENENAAYCYRMNPVSMLHGYDKNIRNSVSHVYEKIEKACKDKGIECFNNQIMAEYLSANIRCYTNELQNPNGFKTMIKNMREISQNPRLKECIKTVDWSVYPYQFKLVVHALEDFNWFHVNITTRILKGIKWLQKKFK